MKSPCSQKVRLNFIGKVIFLIKIYLKGKFADQSMKEITKCLSLKKRFTNFLPQ